MPATTISPPCSPAPGPDVDDVVGDADRLLVVLDDDHGVAEVAQADQRVDEPVVVALVQPDRRLVEHVEHADEAAADLRLASRMRCASPPASVPADAVEREVVEADVEQEPQARVDLLHHPLGDHAVALGQLERARGTRPPRAIDSSHDLVDVAAADRDRERRRLEPGAAARRARHLAHVALDLLARPVALGLGVAALRATGSTPS